MARGALVRLQGRDGSRTSDNEPSLACRASASISGCVRKLLLRLRPSACLTRDHRLVAAIAMRQKTHCAETRPPLGSRASPSAIPSLRSAVTPCTNFTRRYADSDPTLHVTNPPLPLLRGKSAPRVAAPSGWAAFGRDMRFRPRHNLISPRLISARRFRYNTHIP